MKKFLFLILACMVGILVGCSGGGVSDGDGESDPVFVNECVDAGATYELEFVEKGGGTCGPLSPQVMIVSEDKQEVLPEGCSNGPKAGNEGCSVTMDQVCKETVQGMKVETTFTGKVDWNEDGSGGKGTYSITQTVDGEFHCRSTYDATATRL